MCKKGEINPKIKGQVFIEFSLSFFVVLLLLFCAIMLFRWSGFSFVDRRIAHERSLTISVDEGAKGVPEQLKSDFFQMRGFNMEFGNWVY